MRTTSSAAARACWRSPAAKAMVETTVPSVLTAHPQLSPLPMDLTFVRPDTGAGDSMTANSVFDAFGTDVPRFRASHSQTSPSRVRAISERVSRHAQLAIEVTALGPSRSRPGSLQ